VSQIQWFTWLKTKTIVALGGIRMTAERRKQILLAIAILGILAASGIGEAPSPNSGGSAATSGR
jgi:hypothetical protein